MPRKKAEQNVKFLLEKPLPTNLRNLMKERHETQEKLSMIITQEDGSHLSRTAIGSYLNGTAYPDYEIIKQLASHFGVTIDWLVGMPGAVSKPDADLQGVCNYLGISEHVAKTIRMITKEYDNTHSSAVFDALVPDENNAVKFYLGFKNALITLAEADLKNNINGDTNLYSRSHDDCYTPIGMSISELWKNQIQAAFNLLYAEIINNLKDNPVSFFESK